MYLANLRAMADIKETKNSCFSMVHWPIWPRLWSKATLTDIPILTPGFMTHTSTDSLSAVTDDIREYTFFMFPRTYITWTNKKGHTNWQLCSERSCQTWCTTLVPSCKTQVLIVFEKIPMMHDGWTLIWGLSHRLTLTCVIPKEPKHVSNTYNQ